MRSNWMPAFFAGFGGAVLALAFSWSAVGLGFVKVPFNEAAFHDYLLAHPDILVAMTNKLQTDQQATEDNARQSAVDRIGVRAFFDPKIAFITGPANAKNTVVELFDYNCPYCRQSVPGMKAYYEKHKADTRFAFIEFPIKGQQSIIAAKAGLAARKQPDKYVAFHFALMSEQGFADQATVLADAQKAGLDMTRLAADMSASDVVSAINSSHALAVAAKIDGTPVFIVNGHIREGAVDEKMLDALAKG